MMCAEVDGLEPPVRHAPAAPSGARRVLSAAPFRKLLGAQTAGQAADGFAQISFAQLVLFEAGRGASPGALAALLAVTLLPFSVVGPVAGMLIDRYDRRRVLVAASLVRVGIVLGGVPMLAADTTAPAYVAVLALLSTSRFVLAGKGASLPRTVDGGPLVLANALSAVAGMVAAFAGAVVGSTFVARAPAAGFVVAAGLYAAAALVWSRLADLGGGTATVTVGHAVRAGMAEVAAGARFVARTRAVRTPLLAVAAHRFLLGGGFIVLVLVADRRYRLEAPGYGLALAVTGVGAFLGSLAAPRLARRHDERALLPAGFFVAAAAATVAGFDPSLGILVGGIGVAAFGFQTVKVLVDALVQRASPDVVRGRTFAAYDVLYNVAFVAAGLAMVPLWKPERDRALLWGIAVGFAGAGVVLARSVRSPSTPATPPIPAGRRDGRRRGRIAALVAGALPTLAFPEPSWWWLAWVGLVPALLVVRAAPDAREAARRAWAAGTGFFIAAQHWLAPNAGPALVLLGLLLGAVWIPVGRLVHGLLGGRPDARRVLAAGLAIPAVWVAGEFVRSWEALGGPWALLGASQWNRPEVLALASLGGVWLPGALLVAANVAIVALVVQLLPGRAAGSGGGERSSRAAVPVAAGLLTVAAASGPVWRTVAPEPAVERTVVVVGAQPGVVHDAGARFAASEAITERWGGAPPDLVVWGESSVGFDLARRPDLSRRIRRLSRRVGAEILVNTDARRPGGGIYKSSVLVAAEGVAGRYDKMRLVPFGEYLPFRFALGWVSRFTRAADEDRGRGRSLEVLEAEAVRVGPLVCFELAFSDLGRRLTRMGAEVIVAQSSTSTFQGSWAPEQHTTLAAVRAVETGRSVVHATLSGVSSAFDPQARRLAWLGTRRRGAYAAEVPVAVGTTPYVRFGDWVPAVAFGGLLVAAAVRTVRTARAVRAGPRHPGKR
jgi:apolipoprotein N-acyltransferase